MSQDDQGAHNDHDQQWSVLGLCDCLRSSFAFVAAGSSQDTYVGHSKNGLKHGHHLQVVGGHIELANESQNTNQSYRNSNALQGSSQPAAVQKKGAKTTQSSKLNAMMKIFGVGSGSNATSDLSKKTSGGIGNS